MPKRFNVTGACNPRLHYMVNIDKNIDEIRQMTEQGDYFTINRARQYGKTTTLGALDRRLQDDYDVVHMDFQMFSNAVFDSEDAFCTVFVDEILSDAGEDSLKPGGAMEKLALFADKPDKDKDLYTLFRCLRDWFSKSEKPIVLMIDEVDSASNNEVFIDFLAQLRGQYISRTLKGTPAFQSVILAGVRDIRHLKKKIRHSFDDTQTRGGENNSPWNIAADFLIDMSFDRNGIARMLDEYEADHQTGMNTEGMAELIYEYTSGYPFLVSKICSIIDERVAKELSCPDVKQAWTKNGFLEAVKILLLEKNSLFESLLNKLTDYPELVQMLHDMLFSGREISYTLGSEPIENAEMFGFIKKNNGYIVVANRIFEIFLYNYFLTAPKAQCSDIYKMASQNKNQFICEGHLNMKLVLEKFILQFTSLYGSHPEKFYEDEGRKYFLMFLKPIINGTGNYYVEPQTRTATRSDVIVDYMGEQFVIELKIWGGPSYHARGEEQLAGYLDFHGLTTGYMLTFNFNRKKEIGVKEVPYGDKLLIEAIV